MTKSTTFDISSLAVNATAIIELETTDGEPLLSAEGDVLSVTVYGPGSKQFQKAQGVRNRAILDYVRKGGKKMKDDEQRELDAEFLAACTVSFNGFGYKDYTGPEMHKAAYLDPGIGFITDQVNKAVGDWANFTKSPAKS
ncbi:hypothetical protein [Flavobacterium sp.]|uniref:hypothetical protein n=1 Tax=Flavobacterium sp. TaxID=239 RepID=UPI0037C088E6